MADDPIKQISFKNAVTEEGAHELATSPEMQPYIRFAMALMGKGDRAVQLEAIRQIPLNKRYVWRVASALKWGFADFDDITVEVDRQTLETEDFEKVLELLKYRPIQFCMFLKALVGAEEMQRMMIEAIGTAKRSEGHSVFTSFRSPE